VEDIGLTLGEALRRALGDCHGINRAGFFVFPMDEAVSFVAVDFGGRPFLQYEAPFRHQKAGTLATDLIEDFFRAFSNQAQCNLHVVAPRARSDHHLAESVFKAFGKAVKMAVSRDPRARDDVPSTKGLAMFKEPRP
jgi:imidazoleglycerol-phosphate dehydratase